MLSAERIVELHDQWTCDWHEDSPLMDEDDNGTSNAHPDSKPDWLGSVARHHRANFDLWHIEDEARTPGATDAELASMKRRIDSTNQRRNDLTEELDRTLMERHRRSGTFFVKSLYA